MSTNTVSRSLNEVGLAAWFGGALMGVAALPRGGADEQPNQATRIEGRVWQAWQPVMVGAIAAHLAGAVGLTLANRSRIADQRGVAATSIIKAGVTVAALGATALAAKAGRTVEREANEGSETTSEIPNENRLRTVQWAVPVATGALLVLDALMGEQQRPSAVAGGVAEPLAIGRAA